MEVWEDDNANLYIWGTHNPFTAKGLSDTYYEDVLNDEDHLEFATSIADWEDEAKKLWGLPGLPFKENWEPAEISPFPREGWIPFLKLTR